ncbi:serine protease [Pseudonocardia sp. WMMC193]|uniref:S1 family peptidase n=1 Tax=Pseudonocardia sp. WMMC193 TaxID=2911965 RepID=UPI001F42C591|nr:serine protease [Pseudonocardia sp. WMMC193]MCF7553360.1 trypsin-like peptidase domain-containing protein [Pseudonocardia sp. WMMC193]
MTGTFARAAAALAAAATVTLAAAGTASAQESPPAGSPQQASATEKAAAEVRPAIVYLTSTYTAYVGDTDGLYFNQGQPITLTGTCTGFGVNPNGYIATAGHCVDTTTPEGIRRDFVTTVAQDLVSRDPSLPLNDVIEYGMANWSVEGQAKGSPVDVQYAAVIGSGTGSSTDGTSVPARLVDFRPNSQGDVALLKIESTDLPSVDVDKGTSAAIGTPVLSIGYPASADAVTDVTLEPSNKDGQVSTTRTIGSVPFYETSASLSPGMSGGPTVDLEGDVIGINSAYVQGDQAFNFIAPATGLTELMSRNGVQNQLGPNDTLYREALNDYYTGHYSDAIAAFDRLLLVDPDHAQAKQFKTEAAKAKERFGDAVTAAPADQPQSGDEILGMTPWVFWTVVGGGAAVIVGGIALLLVLRRRKGGAAQVVTPALPAPRPTDGYAAWTPGAQGPNLPQRPAAPVWGPQPMPARPAAPSTSGVDSEAQTRIVTPADIVAAQRPAPTVNGSSVPATAAEEGATTVVSVPTTSIECGTCGTTVAPGAVFCSTCGTRQA